MLVRLLTPADYRRMPWKNGGGETIEIALSPEAGGLDAFDWRLSMATVAADGPFSIFPRIDRHLSVLTGAGIRLDLAGGRSVTLTEQSEPFAFPGDVEATGRLIDGPITDLNLMLRRGVLQANVRRIQGEASSAVGDGAVTVLFHSVSDGEVRLDCEAMQVGAGCTLVAQDPDCATVTAWADLGYLIVLRTANAQAR